MNLAQKVYLAILSSAIALILCMIAVPESQVIIAISVLISMVGCALYAIYKSLEGW